MLASEARKQEERMIRRVRLELLIVLGLLALLGGGTYLLFRAQSATLGSSAGVVNICARQRTLSQRAALLIGLLDSSADEAERERLRAELEQIADTMEGHARRLLGGGPALAPPAVRARILDSPHDLAASLRRFVDGVRAAAEPDRSGAAGDDPRVAAAVAAARDGSLLAALDHVVDVMQAHSEAGVRRLQRAHQVAAVLFLATLVVLIGLVFRPLLGDLRRHLAELGRSREELREQRRQLQLNFENAPLGMMRCTREGDLVSVNPALCRMVGAERDELEGRRFEEICRAEDHAQLVDALDRPADDGARPEAMALRLRHRDGSWVTGVLHWSVVAEPDGVALGWIAHFEDRRRQLEAEEQARQDRERLAQLSRLHTLGEMAAGIAHEVNQPLTAISNYAQAGRRMLEKGPADRDILAATLDKVSAQAHRAGEVIRGLRGFVRRRRSRSERVDLNALVSEAVGLAQADAHFLSVPLETRFEPGIPQVLVDPVQIQQVVLNLIRNALDAVEGEGCSEPILVTTAGNGDGFVEVAVRDRGPGVPPEARDRLFDPFYTSKESGLGMGLAISRSIVTGHGGRIWWTPVEGGGTDFHFTLPAA